MSKLVIYSHTSELWVNQGMDIIEVWNKRKITVENKLYISL